MGRSQLDSQRCDATRLDLNGLQLSDKTAYLRYWADKFSGDIEKEQRSEEMACAD